jgi:hypothetical protein
MKEGVYKSGVLVAALSFLAGVFPATASFTVTEDFSSDPSSLWITGGNTNLFVWDPVARNLSVTWDSSQPQSFFALPLIRQVSLAGSFSFSFDLRLTDVQGGVTPDRPGAMQIAAGLINLGEMAAKESGRAAGKAYDTVEVDWFPAGTIPGYGVVEPTISPIIFNSLTQPAASFAYPAPPATNVTYRFTAAYNAGARTFQTTVTADGNPAWMIPTITLNLFYSDFTVDAFAFIVWNQASSQYDSLLAHGTVDNVLVTVPDPPATKFQLLQTSPPIFQFVAAPAYTYRLQASPDLKTWTDVAGPVYATNATLIHFTDTRSGLPSMQFFRIRSSP